MLWFARASVGLAGVFREEFSCIKKLFSSTIFPDFRYMHTGTWGSWFIYIYLGIHARCLICFKKI